MKSFFEEKQKCNLKAIWIFIIAVSCFMFTISAFELSSAFHAEKGASINYFALIFPLLIGAGLPLFLYSLTMTTIVNREGIIIKYFPIGKAVIKADDIRSLEMRSYKAFNEFGGWGIKYGFGKKCYTMSGDKGVEIKLKSGGCILIGSQHNNEFYEAIIKAAGNNTGSL
jgi:hypothetical protein